MMSVEKSQVMSGGGKVWGYLEMQSITDKKSKLLALHVDLKYIMITRHSTRKVIFNP